MLCSGANDATRAANKLSDIVYPWFWIESLTALRGFCKCHQMLMGAFHWVRSIGLQL